jgi:hypothetical protein
MSDIFLGHRNNITFLAKIDQNCYKHLKGLNRVMKMKQHAEHRLCGLRDFRLRVRTSMLQIKSFKKLFTFATERRIVILMAPKVGPTLTYDTDVLAKDLFSRIKDLKSMQNNDNTLTQLFHCSISYFRVCDAMFNANTCH